MFDVLIETGSYWWILAERGDIDHDIFTVLHTIFVRGFSQKRFACIDMY